MTLVLASRLGLVGFGEYALVSAVLFVANVGTTFGTDMVLVREIACTGQTRRAAAATLVQLCLSLVVVCVLWSAAPLIASQRPDVVTALRVISLTLLPGALYGVCTAVLRGMGMMRAYAGVGLASIAIPAAAVIAFVPVGAGVVRATIVLLFAQTAVGVGVWMLCVARIRGLTAVPRSSARDIRAMLRASAPIGVLGLLGMLYQRLPTIALGMFAGPAATSWYSCASRTVEASKAGHVALFGAVYPVMAEGRVADRRDDAVQRDLRRSWRLCIGLGGLVAVALLLIGPILIGRLFGDAFEPSIAGLRILAVAVIPSTIATYQSLALLAAHAEATTLRILSVSLLILVAGTATLVPVMGWIGACWAVLSAETAQAALMLASRRRGDVPALAVTASARLSSVASRG
jgi:O-antigen/teichoic acid export membrane protein